MKKDLTYVSPDRQREAENCNFIKAVLMLVVVVFHCILFWRGNWFIYEPSKTNGILTLIADWMNTFHVYGFALVSGYIFYLLKMEKGKYTEFLPFLKTKAKRLLLPYVFVTAVWIIPVTQIFFKYNWAEILTKYILATSPSQLWFLIMLFDVFIVFWLLGDFFKKHNFLGISLALILYVAGIFGTKIIPNIFCIWTACRYILFFLIGFKIRQYGSDVLMKIPSLVWIAVHIGLFFLDKVFGKIGGLIGKAGGFGTSILLYVVGALTAFVILQKVASKINWKENKVFSLFNKNSMTIYLFHQQVIYFTLEAFNGLLNPYIHSLVNLIASIGVSLIISAILRKFKVTRMLIGEK